MTDELIDLMQTFPANGKAIYDGLVKLKLVHANGFSLLLPELIVIDIDGWKWFQPKFFSACLISFSENAAYGQFNVDTDRGARLFIGITKDRFVRHYADRSQIYRCRIAGPTALEDFATGTCTVEKDSNIQLRLFHHTLPATIDKIRECGYFLGSPWNIQGNKKLENVAYAYFTSLPVIQSDNDLRHIAMASDAKIHLLPTNGTSRRDVITIDVYRQSTCDRRASMEVIVPAELVASQHIWRHAPHGEPVYYEVSHSSIARIGLLPGRALPFADHQIKPVGDEIKRFDYVVLGDADDPEGIVAPYDEEHTQDLFLIENCSAETFFDFWDRHANTDQFGGRPLELHRFEGHD